MTNHRCREVEQQRSTKTKSDVKEPIPEGPTNSATWLCNRCKTREVLPAQNP
jgi:hypothetical protein